jgi:MFS family permease
MFSSSHTAPITVDEASLRYPGWRVVAVCFAVTTFCWGFGLYSHGIYLVELRRLHGWSASQISGAATVYYLLTATLVIFISDAIARLGPRRVLLLGTCFLGSAVVLIAFVAALWQLYAVYLVLAVGTAAMHVGAVTNILGLWFDRQRPLAISLALNGASSGGILVAPALVLAIAAIGFSTAMVDAAVVMAVVLIPGIAIWVGQPPRGGSGTGSAPARAQWTRRSALRSLMFWSVAAPFAMALMAQVGFFVHQIPLLEPTMGRTRAGLAVAVVATAAVIGRIVLGVLALRLDLRRVTALLLVAQVAALFAMMQSTDVVVLFAACVVFGLGAGNLISLPALIIQREFEPTSFGMLIGLSTAIGQFTYAFGPGLLGVIRDVTGDYAASLALCMLLEIAAAGIVLIRTQRKPLDLR